MSSDLRKNQLRFFNWLESEMPELMMLFDKAEPCYLPDQLHNYLGVASSGQCVMAKFVVSVWTHSDEHGFNMIEAAQTLDDYNKAIVTEWFKNPLWP